jgi:hypothetical protein
MNIGTGKTYVAGGALTARQLVKFGADDKTVVAAAAAGDDVIGVTGDLAAASGERVDVFHSGIMSVKAGGTVARGKLVVSDANGNGIQAAPAAGTNNGVLGRSLNDAVSGDLFDVLVQIGTTQG